MVTRRSSVSQPAPAPAVPGATATTTIPQPGATPVEGAADINDAYGTKTLAELREEARRQRKDALIALMPARAALLAEIWYLRQGFSAPQVFGAGLDPAAPVSDPAKGLVRDPNTDQELAAFRDKWMEDPRLGAEWKPALYAIPASPPPAPIRRDSTIGDMSDEVAAVEKELIKPEYRRSAESRTEGASQQSTAAGDARAAQSGGETSAMDLDPPANSSHTSTTNAEGGRNRATSSSLTSQAPPRHRRQSSAISPFPVTFRSPAFQSEAQSQAPATTLSDHPLQQPLTITPSQLTLNPPIPPVEPEELTHDAIEIKSESISSYPTSYAPSLLPLPDALVKNRLAVGGLAQKKAKDRHAQSHPQQQQQQLAQSTAAAAPSQSAAQPAAAGPTTADLYKLGVSQATHSGVRSLVGAGAPAAGKSRTGGKALSTQDWSVAISEFQTLKALERIETLKADKSWSFRQLRKKRAPATYKSHWDYMLEEMRWLATDVKQETRWKAATAYQIALEVRKWHEADKEGKKRLQVKVGQPRYLQEQERAADDSMDTQVVLDTPNASFVDDSVTGAKQEAMQTDDLAGTAANPPPPAAGIRSEKSAPLALENDVGPIPASAVNAQAAIDSLTETPSLAPEVSRDRKHLRELLLAREPVFSLPVTQTVYCLPVSPPSKPASTLESNVKLIPQAYAEVSNFDTFNEALQGLPLYSAPQEPSSDNRHNRRIDEASQHHSRIVNVSHLLESKPLLVSTLAPAKKRKRSGDWSDMLDLTGEDGKDSLIDMYKTNVSDVAFTPGMVRPKDTIGKRGPPPQPPNAEARSLTLDWSPEEDSQLSIYARQYSFNWDLIAHVFNSATRRGSVKMDVRLAWDCYDRYNKKFAQGPANALAIAQPSPALSMQGGVPLPANQAQASPAANGPIPLSKSTRRTSEAAGQLPSPGLLQHSTSSSAVPPALGTPTTKKPEVSKAHRRHELMVEATRKSQMRRAQQQKNNLPPAVRKVNLTSHETHNVPYYPNISALDLSKMKAERERAQLEEIRKREQAKMYQQAQAAAMAQQQQIQQLQAQGQPIPPQLQRSAMQLPPNVRIPNGPQGATGVPSAQLQAVLMQAQRAGHVLPAHMQMAAQRQQQQGQVPPANQANLQRPPSQGGQPGNMVVTPGGTQQPIPLPPMPASQLQSSPPHQTGYPPGMHLAPQGRTGSPQNSMTAHNASQSPQPSHMQMSPHAMQMQLQQGQMPQLTQAQQQAFLAQLAAQGRTGSPNMGMVGLPGGFPVQNGQQPQQQQQPQLPPMSPEQQQQLLAMMRMRQSSQGSQASVQ